jgi:hypothetical protein
MFTFQQQANPSSSYFSCKDCDIEYNAIDNYEEKQMDGDVVKPEYYYDSLANSEFNYFNKATGECVLKVPNGTSCQNQKDWG